MEHASTLDHLAHLGSMAADMKVIAAEMAGCTPAEATRVAVEAALTQLEAQGYIEFVDPGNWPDYFMPDGPIPA